MWQEAATALNLSQPQSDAITALWHDLDAKLGALLDGRRTLHARIRGTMPNGAFDPPLLSLLSALMLSN